jgi:hypothetical protein
VSPQRSGTPRDNYLAHLRRAANALAAGAAGLSSGGVSPFGGHGHGGLKKEDHRECFASVYVDSFFLIKAVRIGFGI